jgi:hypothetical protein
MDNQMKIEQSLTQIKEIVSDIVGQDPSVFAEVERANTIGVRTVDIYITHEAGNKTSRQQEIVDVLADKTQSVLNSLLNKGYSVSDGSDVTGITREYGRFCILSRCSLLPVMKTEIKAPVYNTTDQIELNKKLSNIDVLDPK